jgi:hypothetical protein
MGVSYTWAVDFCRLNYLEIRQKSNSTVAEQPELTEGNATELCLLPAS